ncbi:MAG: hydroxymethylpyrimidine/phosphomethylpyrimidine kinase [Herminiimonas sp.]|nr:hydroxymethylpyrimidine/phosphomethylpyrimidine kinase [Herminiimonas sp.]
MQNQTSPLILSFGATDPVGAVGIQADLASFAAMGCHGLSVVTGILLGDTTHVEDIQAVDADWVADQARILLEDMPVAAFKVGCMGSVENITVIAEIVSDYPDVPLILDPFTTAVPEQVLESDDLVIAMRELLVPQTTLLMLSQVELSRLAETWREPSNDDTLAVDATHLIESGCEFVLVTGTPSDIQEVANTLYDKSGVVREDHWPRQPGTFTGAGATLSATIAAMLANGMDVPEAVREAQEFTVAALAHAQRLGMGKLVPDRYFWARDNGDLVAVGEPDEPGAAGVPDEGEPESPENEPGLPGLPATGKHRGR